MVELSFEHPFLLHGILALSAVHKASFLLPMERQDLLLQADLHISQALETFRRHLEAPSDEAAIPMFVLSSLLLTYNFGSIQEKPDDPIGALHHCIMLLNGIKLVVTPHWEKLKGSTVIAQMFETSSPEARQLLDARSKNDERPEILRLLELTELVLDAGDKTVCADAIRELHSVSLRVRHVDADRDEYPVLFYWAAAVSNRFFELFAAHSPVACIITVHFAALFAQARPIWWVFKWPRWLLAATEQVLASTPDLQSWLHWPRDVINSAPSPAKTTTTVSF